MLNGDVRRFQKLLEGWRQDITQGAYTPKWCDADDDDLSEGDKGRERDFENLEFAFCHHGFKQIRLLNFEADGHVIVQVMGSSFKLYEMATFIYDETKPTETLEMNRWYFAKVDLADGTVFGTRAEYQGESMWKNRVKMYFADIGKTEYVDRAHIYEIENYADAADLPPQAVKVSVAGLTNMGYSLQQLLSICEDWFSSNDTIYMLRAKPPRKQKHLERTTGVPRVLITNQKGQVLGVWKKPTGHLSSVVCPDPVE